VTSGVFELDGGSWEVDNNVWVIGDDNECFVIDAAHEPVTILSVVGDRHVLGILCTHGHNDHINAVPELVSHTGAAAYLHPADRVLWDQTQEAAPTGELATVRPLPWAMSSCGCSTRRVTHRVRAVSTCRLLMCSSPATPSSTAVRGHGAVLLGLPDDHRLDPR
jgi:hypothetical protein